MKYQKKNFDEGSKPLRNLAIGDTVLCQNNKTKKWDWVACIVEFKGYRQYVVKLAGSGRLSLRNRRHLQPVSEQCFLPFATKNSSKIVSTHEPVMEETKTSKNNELFSKGRHADIFVNEKKVGEIGEIDSNILENFRIRTSVVGFEIKLSGLIFD